MNKAKQFVIALLCGMDADHAMMKDLKMDADLAQGLLNIGPVTKADILSLDANGRSFFEFPETWDSLPRLRKIMHDNGERLESADFVRGIVNNRSLVKMAGELNVLDRAFQPDIWAGHAREMETVWFSIDKYKRDKFDFDGIRRALAAREGRELREDQLQRAGISKGDMRAAIRDGRLDAVKEKLAAHGDKLRAEDLLLLDDTGDNAMDTTTAWNNAQATFDEMNKQGVHFEPWHFLFKCGDKKNILTMALECGDKGVKHLFNARIWAERPEALMELYNHVPDDKRGEIGVASVMDEIYNDMYGKVVDVQDPSAADLVTPLNGGGADRVLPLGIKAVWDAMPEIRAALARSGQKIGIEQLRQTSGALGESCLMQAVRFGKLDQVMEIMADSHEKLTFDDLMAKGEDQSETLLQLICKADQQAALLDPSHWIGRGEELLKVWDAMSEGERKGIDFRHIHSEMNRQTLRQRFAGGPSAALKHTM